MHRAAAGALVANLQRGTAELTTGFVARVAYALALDVAGGEHAALAADAAATV